MSNPLAYATTALIGVVGERNLSPQVAREASYETIRSFLQDGIDEGRPGMAAYMKVLEDLNTQFQ